MANYTAEDVQFFRNHLKTNGGLEIFIKHLMQVGQQNVHTPFGLCREMISKLAEYTSLNDKEIAVLFNIEFLHVLLRDFNVSTEHLTIFVDDEREYDFCKYEYGMEPEKGLFYIDMERTIENRRLYTPKGEYMKKFDCVVGNPPYQELVDGNNRNKVLWDKFVRLSIQLAKENGYICLVHPASWRQPCNSINKLWNEFTKMQFEHLDIHSKQEGEKVFGAVTRFDWYVMHNRPAYKQTHVVFQDNSEEDVELFKLPFLPNAEFDLLNKILATPTEERCKIHFSQSIHDPRKEWMNKDESKKFCFPCVYLLNSKGIEFRYSSRNDKGHFGIQKVIVSCGERPYPMLDYEGKYGMCQATFGIEVSTKSEAECIKKVIESEKFMKLIWATKWGNFRIDPNMFKYFKKDFWKEFV